MKRTAFILSILLTLLLSACSSAFNTSNPQAPGVPTSELPMTTQLILGTIRLDTTDQAVTQEQAAKLLPLWQTMQVLSDSDTAAQQEKDALVEQIQETMSAEQIQALTGMSLSRADMMTVMQEQGPVISGPTSGQNSTTQNGASSNNNGRNFGPGGLIF